MTNGTHYRVPYYNKPETVASNDGFFEESIMTIEASEIITGDMIGSKTTPQLCTSTAAHPYRPIIVLFAVIWPRATSRSGVSNS